MSALPAKGARTSAALFHDAPRAIVPEVLMPQAAPVAAPAPGITMADIKEFMMLAKDLGIDFGELLRPRAAAPATPPIQVLSESVRRETVATPAVKEVHAQPAPPPELTDAQKELLERLRGLSDPQVKEIVVALVDMVPRDVILDFAAKQLRGRPDSEAKLALKMLGDFAPVPVKA